MKKVVFLFIAICGVLLAKAQEVPYSKYLNFSKSDFKECRFKYDDYTNTWTLRKINGLSTTINILAIIADAGESVRPDSDDYAITVQMGKENKASYVKVSFYSDETYHKIMSFMKMHCPDLIDVSSGKLVRHQAFYQNLLLEMTMERHIKSRISSRTADHRTLKNVDESYNKYIFVIATDVEPSSDYLDEEEAKRMKREAKGKKKQTVDELM